MAKIAIRVMIAPVYLEADDSMSEEEITAMVEGQMLTNRSDGWEYRDDWRN